MAEIKQFTYTNSGTEMDFIQGLLDIISSFDENITIENESGSPTTVSEQYADLTSAGQATFYINFGGQVRWCIRRSYANSVNASSFDFSVEGVARAQVFYMGTGKTPGTITGRTYQVAYLKSETVIILWLGRYNNTSVSQANGSLITIKTENEIFTGSNTAANILGASLYNGTISVSYSSALAYSAEAGKVDFIEKSVFVSNGMRTFEVSDIKSCSTMPQFSTIALPDGRNFFTIASNAMVEIDTEDDGNS